MSIPVETSVAENEGPVRICAELSITPPSAVTGDDVTITLLTADSMSGEYSL